jgi:hypothetical protein
MANDRGGTSRGGAGDQWAQMPGGRRMPQAPRERRPALAVLALLLVVGGAAASGYLALSASKKVAAIEITQNLVPGEQIALGDMQEEDIAGASGGSYTPWSLRNEVAGNDAKTTIPVGTLLIAGMTEQPGSQQNNGPQVGLNVKAGQIPANLQVGDTVDVIQLVGASGSSSNSNSNPTCPATQTDNPIALAVVNNISPNASGDGANVTLSLSDNPPNPQTAAYIAGCASDQLIGLVYLPYQHGTG